MRVILQYVSTCACARDLFNGCSWEFSIGSATAACSTWITESASREEGAQGGARSRESVTECFVNGGTSNLKTANACVQRKKRVEGALHSSNDRGAA